MIGENKSGLLALDIGTSSVRITVFEKDKGIQDRYTITHKIAARFSIEELWIDVKTLISKAVRSNPGITFNAIGISAFLGWVVIDHKGLPVEEAWSWMADGDLKEVEKYTAKLPRNTEERIGRNVNEELGVFRWGCCLRNSSETRILLSVKDYINYKLTGNIKMDRTHASYTGLFSIKTRDWESALLDTFNIPKCSLPVLGDGIDEAGIVKNDIATELGIDEKIKVILSGPDGTLAMLGGGGSSKGKTVEVMGTTDVLFHICDYIADPSLITKGIVQNCYIIPGLYAIGGPTGMTGGTLTWLMDKWNWSFQSSEYENMLQTWEKRKPAINGVFIIPFLTGARVPDWNQSMRFTVVGLNNSHNLADIFKATVEGIAFSSRRILERLSPFVKDLNSFIAIGGGSREGKLLKTRAAASGKTIQLPYEREASTVGVFALSATLLNWFINIEDAVKSMNPIVSEIIPEQNILNSYSESFKRFNHLFTIMDSWYKKTEG